jgi:hypothetical protein
MSSKGSVTKAAEKQQENNQKQSVEIGNQVKKDLGLVNGVATNLKGKDQTMYGREASEFAKQRMDDAGLGTYNKETGSFQNIVGNTIINTGATMGTRMGSGESTIMGQVPISEDMFESQKRLQMIATGAMSALGVPLMGAAFMDYNRKKYSDYVTSFNNTLQSSTSYATKTNESKSDNKEINTSSNVTVNDSGVDGGPSEAARLKKLALTKQTAAVNAERKLFNTTKQTITGAMV